MASFQNLDPARLDASCTCDPVTEPCCAPFLTAPDGTPISNTPGAVLPMTIIQTQRVGVATWATAPLPDPV